MTAPRLAGTFQPCTTHSNRRKHLSVNLTPSSRGSIGTTLCGEKAYNQMALDYRLQGFKTPRRIWFLPPCKSCERSAARGIS